MNLELLKHAKDYIEKMANGINPLTNEKVSENDIINNVRIARCLFYVNNVLGEVLLNGGIKNNSNKKIPFNIKKEEINKYKYSEEDLTISKIVKKINELRPSDNMTKLKATDVCNWLISIGLMMEDTLYDKKVKRPTEKGKLIGMYVEHRIGTTMGYDVILYKKGAQKFIIDNIEKITEFINA